APTEQEREEHNLTKRRMQQPVTQCDYSFMSDKGQENHVTLLNVRDVITGMSTSNCSCDIVPNKGHSVYAEAELRRFVLDIGRTFGILQCDPEPELKAVVETVPSEVGGLSLRNSPAEWKQAQGAVGQAHALLYSQVRVLRLDLAERYDCQVPATSPVFPWLKHAQFLLNNFFVRTDGQTPYERRWDRKYTSPVCVFKTRSVRRLPAENQVSEDLLEALKATPWDPRGRQEESANFILPGPQPDASTAVADAQGAPVAEAEDSRRTLRAPSAVLSRLWKASLRNFG
ncbi:unnamed protein product, partial [Symbiodinium sp. KB8]